MQTCTRLMIIKSQKDLSLPWDIFYNQGFPRPPGGHNDLSQCQVQLGKATFFQSQFQGEGLIMMQLNHQAFIHQFYYSGDINIVQLTPCSKHTSHISKESSAMDR